MFRRKRAPQAPEPSADGPRDPNLPMLSVPQAAALGQLAERAFRAHGLPATYEGDGTLATGETRFGLHNLASMVSGVPWRDWPHLVDGHAAAMAGAQAAEDDARPVPEQQKLLKLRAASDLPFPPEFAAESGLPGILALPAVDRPTHVREILKQEDVDALGGLDAFREAGLANLRTLPAPQHFAVESDEERADSTVHVFAAEDFFGASRVLVLDHLLATVLKTERPQHGCLVAVPNRHLLAVHLLSGAGVVAALTAMAKIADGEQDAPGPISREVFYLPPEGRGQQVTEYGEDGLRVIVDGPFADAFARLGLIGEE